MTDTAGEHPGRCQAEDANHRAAFEAMAAEYERPTLTVAGVQVTLYVDPDTGQVRVSVDLDTAAAWLQRADDQDTVSLRVTVGAATIFED